MDAAVGSPAPSGEPAELAAGAPAPAAFRPQWVRFANIDLGPSDAHARQRIIERTSLDEQQVIAQLCHPLAPCLMVRWSEMRSFHLVFDPSSERFFVPIVYFPMTAQGQVIASADARYAHMLFPWGGVVTVLEQSMFEADFGPVGAHDLLQVAQLALPQARFDRWCDEQPWARLPLRRSDMTLRVTSRLDGQQVVGEWAHPLQVLPRSLFRAGGRLAELAQEPSFWRTAARSLHQHFGHRAAEVVQAVSSVEICWRTRPVLALLDAVGRDEVVLQLAGRALRREEVSMDLVFAHDARLVSVMRRGAAIPAELRRLEALPDWCRSPGFLEEVLKTLGRSMREASAGELEAALGRISELRLSVDGAEPIDVLQLEPDLPQRLRNEFKARDRARHSG